TLESEYQIEILEDKEYIEINNIVFNKIEYEGSCLSKKNKETLHKSRNKQLANILLFEKLNKEIEYLQETEISKYKKYEKFKTRTKEFFLKKRINRATNIKELNDLKPTEITLDPILKIKQSNTLKNREIPKRIREIVDLIYNKILNETENISTLDQFIISVSGGGELTENIYILGENEDLLKNKKVPLDNIVKIFLNNSLFMLNNYYNNDSMKNQIKRLEIYKKQNTFNIIIEEIKKYISDFERHLNFVNFKLNKNKTFDRTNFFYTKTLKDHITKIKTLYHEANENYYQDIINKMIISTNKEDFKDNGKFDKEIHILDNKYLKGKKTTDLQNIRKKKN
ncbi:1244_t:CDS:2, partial [Gigaspora margarita]